MGLPLAAGVAGTVLIACDFGLGPIDLSGLDLGCPTAPPHESYSQGFFSCSGPTCDWGWGDCNGDPSDGCETDLTSASAACGACGFPCPAGSSCNAASCYAPEDVATIDGVTAGGTLVVGGGVAYVQALEALYAIPLPGGSPTLLTLTTASILYADDDGVYWVDPGVDGGSASLRTTTAAAGGAPRTVTPAADDVSAIVGSDAEHVYVTRARAHCVSWILKGSGLEGDVACDPKMGPSGTYSGSHPGLPWAAVVDGSAFWLSSGDLAGQAFPHGTPSTLSTSFDAAGLAASAGEVYGAGNGYERLDRSTGEVGVLVSAVGPPSAIAAADVALFAVASGTVWRYGVDGSETLLAGFQQGVGNVAVDGSYVYWLASTTPDGAPAGLTLRRLPETP